MHLEQRRLTCVNLATAVILSLGLFLLLNATLWAADASPDDRFVSATGSGTACSQAVPCPLHTALGQAVDGDTVYVGQGIYTGTGGAVLSVTHSISLYGGWDGTITVPPLRDPEIHRTTLDGQGVRHVIFIGDDASPTVDGFVITGGWGEDGGGIHIYGAAPLIQNNVITANHTVTSGSYINGRGGGIYVGGFGNAVISHNLIISNASGYGGGIYHDGSEVITIIADDIIGNRASRRGGGIMVENRADIIQGNVISGNVAGSGGGGGIMIWHAACHVEANRIIRNVAGGGGGISMGNHATPSILNNLVISNSRDGIQVGYSSSSIVNNTIVGSGLSDSGHGINLAGSTSCSSPDCNGGLIINNIVISYNSGIVGFNQITPTIDYNDVWGNLAANYSLPPGVVTGTHNISQDPRFVDPTVDNYHLQTDSPCINAGDPAGVPPAPATDIDGNPRPSCIAVDLGAYEEHEPDCFHIDLPLILRGYGP
jgi:hypothetical protein